MKIELNISSEIIANMMISAFESGDPVTTAARGGWCNGINLPAESSDALWYAEPTFWRGDFQIEIIEVDDESTGHETKHKVDRARMQAGLVTMARKFPHIFAHILSDDTDAPCADIFLQCICFGEEKYG